MREIVELRVVEEFAPLLFAPDEGKRLGDSVRKIELDRDDPRFARVGVLQRELVERENRQFFYGWKLRRIYSAKELAAATVLRFQPTAFFEPAGEECGTRYDESHACTLCGAGARQVGPLVLDVDRIPKRKDFAQTIAGELVVSRRVRDLMAQEGSSGATFGPVRSRSGDESDAWYQRVPAVIDVDIAPETIVGIGLFDEDAQGHYRCTKGDLIGLNLLSEVSVSATTRGTADIFASRQFIGVRRGLLRPERVIMVSPRTRHSIIDQQLQGCEFEVVHVV